MSTLIITRGLPGTGKTTRARAWVAEDEENRARVNRDDLRQNLYGRYSGLSFPLEQAITVAQRAAVIGLIESGKDVVVDDTHLRLRNARAWADLAVERGWDFEVWEIELDVEEAIKRDRLRDRQVGEDVIRGMHARYANRPEIKPSERVAPIAPAPYVADLSKPRAWLVDIDGTLAHMGDRNPYDITTVSGDSPDPLIVGLVANLSLDTKVIVMSGRSDECRAETEQWLDEHLGAELYDELHMRAADDKRADFKVKADLFDAHIRDRFNVVGVLDDRDQVVKMWRGMGLKCLQVADGDF